MGPSVALSGSRGPVLPKYAGISTRITTQEKAASQSVPTEGMKPAIMSTDPQSGRSGGSSGGKKLICDLYSRKHPTCVSYIAS